MSEFTRATPGRRRLLSTAVLIAAIGIQSWTHYQFVDVHAEPTPLPAAPTLAAARIATLGDPIAAAKLGVLWLQSHDNQPGMSVPFRSMDYAQLKRWLKLLLDLDPHAQYPLLAAARIYTEVPDIEKQRLMMEFVYSEFARDPQHRWPWLAHIAVLAKHRLKDQALALKYARALADTPSNITIPSWARQAEIFLLADQGEFESARVLVGGLLAQGLIRSRQEIEFLRERLMRMETQNQLTQNEKEGQP